MAEAARISQATIAAYESGTSIPMINNLLAIQAALEAAGVTFIPENGGGPGVRLKNPIREG